MKTRLFAYAAAMAVTAGMAPAFAEDDQAPAAPAGSRHAPQPSVHEELVYLRDIIALQTLRLDEAEQLIARQSALIERQQGQISSLERLVMETRSAQQQLAAGAVLSSSDAYVVRSGDTLGGVAARHGTTIRALAEANSLTAPYTLRVGQRLTVPAATPADRPPAPAQVAAAAPAQPPQPATPQPSQQAPHATPATPPQPQPQPQQPRPGEPPRPVADVRREAQASPDPALPQEVGQRPEEERQSPYLAIFSDVGGILTPKGRLFVEPEVDYSVTADNRFFFQGVEIIDAILIGLIEATNTDRTASSARLGMRYGLTSRLEVDARMSYISRDDRIAGVAIDSSTEFVRDISGSGLGDAEFGIHYQLNNGRRWPYAIANVRAKAPTGLGPFHVARDANGIEQELATGSGFWTIEPSLTFILPTDPAVIFGNVGYQLNLSPAVDTQIGSSRIIGYDPGDAWRASLGMGISLNERMSINFGYDLTLFERSVTTVEVMDATTMQPVQITSRSPRATVGSFLFGGSYVVNDRLRLNLNTSLGATDEAPDMRVSLRAQIRLFD